MRRHSLVAVVATFVVGLSVAAAVSPIANAYNGGEDHTLTVMHSGKCLDREYTLGFRGIKLFNPNDGAAAVQSACTGVGGIAQLCRVPSGCAPTNQFWRLDFTGISGPMLVQNRQSGKCLDVAGDSTMYYASVVQMPCDGTDSQLWNIYAVRYLNGIPYYVLDNLHSGQCLTVAWSSMNDGAAVVQADCTWTDNQLWDIYNVPFNYHGV